VTFTTLATGAADETSYDDLTITDGMDYTYRVSAVGPDGDLSIGVPLATASTPPPAASDVVGVSDTDTSVDVTWVDNSNGHAQNLIERSEDGGDTWTEIADTNPGVADFVDTGLTEGTTYDYRVTPHAAGGNGGSAHGSGKSAPAAPGNLAGMSISTT